MDVLKMVCIFVRVQGFKAILPMVPRTFWLVVGVVCYRGLDGGVGRGVGDIDCAGD